MATFDRRDLMREAAATAGEAQCAARSKQSGERCKKSPMPGSNVCRVHGGSAPQVKAAARRRLEEASERMAERLLGLAENTLDDGTKVGAYVQLGAVTAALDRAGIVEQKQLNVEVTAKPYESLLADVEGGSRDAYRRSIDDPRAGELPPAIEHTNRPGGPPTEPTGVRVLGETFDGSLVIDVDQADDDADETTEAQAHDDATEAHKRATESLANVVTPATTVQGYLPSDDAREQVAEANRAYRHRMTRR